MNSCRFKSPRVCSEQQRAAGPAKVWNGEDGELPNRVGGLKVRRDCSMGRKRERLEEVKE